MEQEQTLPETLIETQIAQPEAETSAHEEEERGQPEAKNAAAPPAETPRLSEADALTAARLMELLSQAEERGYKRARREMEASAPREIPLWGNPRRIEADEQAAADKVKIGDDFLTRIRPAIWD